ncbi:MAG: hypothetical protein M0R80_19195 [Proteobacteria bacterium]|jgi:hypothetical protein|nr:hypothetical protein [Pseudomonadota bacterium]
MNCTYCGQLLHDRDSECVNCGAAVVGTQRPASGGSGLGIAAEAPGKGTRVLGRWGNGLWYPGVIDDERGASRHVLFDDGDQAWRGPQDLTAEGDAPDAKGAGIALGAKVMGQWANRGWYAGTVDKRFGRAFHVAFADGDRAWLGTERIRVGQASRWLAVAAVVLLLLVAAGGLIWLTVDGSGESGAGAAAPAAPPLAIRPMEPLAAPPVVGARVLAPFGDGAYYFAATVRAVRPDGQVELLFLDGDQAIAPAASLRQENVGPGTMVSARLPSLREWYAGQVRERDGDRVLVRFDDGDVRWVPLSAVRHAAPPQSISR